MHGMSYLSRTAPVLEIVSNVPSLANISAIVRLGREQMYRAGSYSIEKIP